MLGEEIEASQDPVVGCYKESVGSGHGQGAPGCTHSGVNDNDVDGAGRKVAEALGNQEGTLLYCLRKDAVGDVDYGGVGVDAEDDALHQPNVGIAEAKVGGKGDERAGHRRRDYA